MNKSGKFGFTLVAGLVLVVGIGVSLFNGTHTTKEVYPLRPTTPNSDKAAPHVERVKASGVVERPNIVSSSETLAKEDTFTEVSATALKYIKVDPAKATCMCDVVDYNSVMRTMNDLKRILETNDEAYLLIDSPGGSVFDGAMLVSFIEGSKKPIHTVAVGMAASMGFQLLQVGYTRMATDNAAIMAHPAAGGVRGTVAEMEALLSFIKRYTEKWDRKTAARAGIPYDKFEIMVLKNIWVTAEEAKSLNLIDEVVYLE